MCALTFKVMKRLNFELEERNGSVGAFKAPSDLVLSRASSFRQITLILILCKMARRISHLFATGEWYLRIHVLSVAESH